MLHNLVPAAGHVGSRRWYLWVNRIAASPYISHGTRKRIYRRLGLDISPDTGEIGFGCYFHSSNIAIGSRTFINDFCYFENVERVTLGDDVAIGMHAAIVTSTHELGPAEDRSGSWLLQPVTVEDGCWIGARALILAGVTVGHGAVVAAGAVVASDCEPNCLYAGVPARAVRKLDG